MFDSNPATGIPDTAGYPVTIPMDPNDWRLKAIESMDPVQKAKAFDELIHKGTCDIELEARTRPVSDPQAINQRRSFLADALRRWGKGRTGAEKLSSPVVKPEAPFLPACMNVPYESVVDADIPEGYTPQPVTLGKPEASNPTAKQPEACCGNSCNRNATGDDATQAAVCESMRLLADKCPVEHLAAAVQRMAANSDGVVLFPARVISRLAATVLAMSKNIGTN